MAPSPASAAAAQLSSSQKVVAPKGRARPANKGGTATKTLGRPLRHSAESQASAQAAPSVQAKLTDDLAVILADETFTNIEDENPYDIKDCSGEDECHAEDLTAGKQSPFDSDEARNSLKSTSRYDCAVNFFWFDVYSTPSPQLPVFSKMVADYEKEHWPNPAADPGFFPVQLNALLAYGDGADVNGWMCGSALEPRAAAISACRKAIDNGCDETTKLKWKRLFLTCNGSLELVDETLWKFKLMAATNEIQSLWSASGRNALKDIFAIWEHKNDVEIKQGKVSAADVAKSWNTMYGRISDGGEPLTEGYVDTCLYVKRQIMVSPEILALLLEDVETFGHKAFFDTPFKMRVVAQKTKSQDIMSYVFSMLFRLYKTENIGHLSVRDLDGGSTSSAKKGMIETIVYLHGFVEYILKEWMVQSQAFNLESMNLFQKLFDFNDFKHYESCTNPENLDQTWRRALTPVGDAMMELLSTLSPNLHHESLRCLQTAMKSKMNHKECLEKAFSIQLETITDAIAVVKAELEKAQAQPVTAPGTAPPATPVKEKTAEDPADVEILGTSSLFDDKKSSALKALDQDGKAKMIGARQKAKQIVCTWVTLIAEDKKSEAELLKSLQQSPIGKAKPCMEPGKIIAIWHDCKKRGESSTQPHLRIPPFVPEDYRSKVKTSLMLFHSSDDPKIADGVVHLHFLGWKQIGTQITNFYSDDRGDKKVSIPLSKKDFFCVYSESCLLDRRCSIQGYVRQSEAVIQLTSPTAKLEVPETLPHRQRTRYYGSNIGDSIGYISLTPWNQSWSKTFDQKKQMLGTKRRDVGGKVDNQPFKERHNNDVEPVVYTSMPQECYDELGDELCLQGSIDFDAADGLNAMSHIEAHRQYTGVCWTTTHTNLLMDHLIDQVFFRMTSVEKSRYFDPTLAALMGTQVGSPPKGNNKREAATLGDKVTPKKPRASKKAETPDGTGETPPTPPNPPAKNGGTVDKKLDLLNMLKQLKKPGVAAGGGAGGDIMIDDEDEDEVSGDNE